MNAEDYIRKQIQRILSEGGEAEKPSPEKPKPSAPEGEKKKKRAARRGKKKGGQLKVSVGKGGRKEAIGKSAARVEADPSGLLSDLGASLGKGNNDAQRILGLVRSAIYGTDVMAAAYVGANLITRQDGSKQINIAVKALKPRDGVYFMEHVLVAAQNTGQLSNLTQNVTLATGGGGLSITFE